MTTTSAPKLSIYLGALATSILIAWIVGAFCLSSPTLLERDPLLNLAVPIENSTTHFRAEGHSDTTYGKHGLTQIDAAKLDSDKPKIIIWGDSYVEAHQVESSLRMQNHAELQSQKPVDFLAVGYSGRSLADYYFLIPAYQSIVDNNIGNVIFLGSHTDILPSQKSSLFSKLTINNMGQPVWIAAKPRGDSSKLSVRANSIHPYFFRTLARKLKTVDTPKLYRSVSVDTEKTTAEVEFDRISFWRRVLQDLKRQSGQPLLFVYAPQVPKLAKNKIVTDDAQQDLMLEFSNACRKEGVGFKNLAAEFVTAFESENILVRGFPNSRPSQGHLNQHGHRIAGQAIADCTSEWLSDFYSD